LAQITGGKEAEIEQYCQMLVKIQDDNLIQDGILWSLYDPIVEVVNDAANPFADGVEVEESTLIL
jgi:hypothetical protein